MKKGFGWSSAAAAVLTAVCVVPFLYVFLLGLRSTDGHFTLKYYYQVFLGQSQYLIRFWKSLALSLLIAGFQVLVSVLAGYSFAKCRYPGRNALFFEMMILMIMPLQVTLVPNYLMLDEMGLLNTYACLALPAIFTPLGAFIMTRSFQSVPSEVIDAARLDGCGTFRVIFRIAAPIGKNGLVCTLLLSFLNGWNMVEQPMVYIQDFGKYPLSVALASVPPEDPNILLVCCVLAALPPVYLFAFFDRELVEGITVGGGK